MTYFEYMTKLANLLADKEPDVCSLVFRRKADTVIICDIMIKTAKGFKDRLYTCIMDYVTDVSAPSLLIGLDVKGIKWNVETVLISDTLNSDMNDIIEWCELSGYSYTIMKELDDIDLDDIDIDD